MQEQLTLLDMTGLEGALKNPGNASWKYYELTQPFPKTDILGNPIKDDPTYIFDFDNREEKMDRGDLLTNAAKSTIFNGYDPQYARGSYLQPLTAVSDGQYIAHIAGEQRLYYLSRKLRRALSHGKRDNYLLAEISKTILHEYNYHMTVLQDGKYDEYRPIVHADRQEGKLKRVDFHRAEACGAMRKDFSVVPVQETTETGSIIVKAQMHCGSVWVCPRCASLIQSRNKERLDELAHKIEAKGGKAYLVTFTFPHTKGMRLNDVGVRLQQAFRHFLNSKAFKFLRQKLGYIGKTKSCEYTMGGDNGFHKHFHVLFVFDKYHTLADKIFLENTIRYQWEKSCAKYGLIDTDNAKQIKDFRDHAVDLKETFAHDYLAKQDDHWFDEHADGDSLKRQAQNPNSWNASHELSLSTTKISKTKKSFSPFGLLVEIALLMCRIKEASSDDPDTFRNIQTLREYIDMYIEYACHTFGTQSLTWDHSLLAWADMDAKTDEEIAEEEEEHAVTVAGIDREQINTLNKYALMKEFKDILKHEGVEAVNEMFAVIGLRPLYDAKTADETYKKEYARWLEKVEDMRRSREFYKHALQI